MLRCARFVLRRMVVDRATITAVARELGRSWDTPVMTQTGPARLLDLVEGRSTAAFADWLAARTPAFRAQVRVVAMDGFTGYKTAAAEAVPDAVTVMDPFYVVALAGAKLDECRQRLKQQLLGRRGRSGDPLYRVRRVLRTRTALLTARQQTRLDAVFAVEEHAPVQVTHWIYQQAIAAYAHPDPRQGRTLLTGVIDTIRAGVPAGLEELTTLGRTLRRRRDDVLAYFTHRASNARLRPSTAGSKPYAPTAWASAT